MSREFRVGDVVVVTVECEHDLSPLFVGEVFEVSQAITLAGARLVAKDLGGGAARWARADRCQLVREDER